MSANIDLLFAALKQTKHNNSSSAIFGLLIAI